MKNTEIREGSVMMRKAFENSPERLKDLFFESLLSGYDSRSAISIFRNAFNIKSPIEQLFYFSFHYCFSLRRKEITCGIETYEQKEVYCSNGKKYIPDFVISLGNQEHESVDTAQFNIAIECDGYEYHERDKQKIAYDNQRELDLKTNGFDVIHFSGSQLYKSPIKCANSLIDYIIKLQLKIDYSLNESKIDQLFDDFFNKTESTQ